MADYVMTIAVLYFLAGLGFLYFGAEALIRGAAALGLKYGLSPLVVGLTIVAFGTSAPELVVSINAAAGNQTDMAIANVLGSNVANIGLILGIAALIRPLDVHVKLIRIDVPLMIAVSLLPAVLLWDGLLTRLDGAILCAGIIGFIAFNILAARRARPESQALHGEELPAGPDRVLTDIALMIAGLVVLALGGQLLVQGAVEIARYAGMSEAVIGLTIVAVGTSLPELATSVLAAARKMGDLSIGNIIGSNIFNILAILGTTSLLIPLPQGGVSRTDLLVMILFALAVLPLARSGFVLKRWEGITLLLAYVAYLSWLLTGSG